MASRFITRQCRLDGLMVCSHMRLQLLIQADCLLATFKTQSAFSSSAYEWTSIRAKPSRWTLLHELHKTRSATVGAMSSLQVSHFGQNLKRNLTEDSG